MVLTGLLGQGFRFWRFNCSGEMMAWNTLSIEMRFYHGSRYVNTYPEQQDIDDRRNYAWWIADKNCRISIQVTSHIYIHIYIGETKSTKPVSRLLTDIVSLFSLLFSAGKIQPSLKRQSISSILLGQPCFQGQRSSHGLSILGLTLCTVSVGEFNQNLIDKGCLRLAALDGRGTVSRLIYFR